MVNEYHSESKNRSNFAGDGKKGLFRPCDKALRRRIAYFFAVKSFKIVWIPTLRGDYFDKRRFGPPPPRGFFYKKPLRMAKKFYNCLKALQAPAA